MPAETPEERLRRFNEVMQKAGASFEGAPAPATSNPPAEATTSTPAAPAAETPPATTSAPAAETTATTPPAETPSRWKRKIKALDEERVIDLETMPESELDALLGKGIAYDPVKERLRSARDNAIEALEDAKGKAASARDHVWVTELQRQGFTIERDATQPQGIRIAHLNPQTSGNGASAQGQAIDLDALERDATTENTPEAWAKYNRALRKFVESKTTDSATIDQRVEAKILETQRKLAETERQKKEQESLVTAFQGKVEGTVRALDAKFSKAGDLKDHWITVARERARAHSFDPNATEESVLKVFHDTADLVERSWAMAQGQLSSSAAPPRTSAPTVLPRGGAPTASPADPRKIDRSTPDGKRAAAQLLEKLARERGHALPV